ncbi:uncharacterized protein CMU_032610 [Cryptosporidium muris RN66]|uniref:MICOS complex subunit MIC10 n=1 Tax=Cryptosporidium muris (strain RN66) TaxID=441375 RepID=B6AF85_CRYMR|nr:uncharacterized protein CMU_032610 [Cryptosporidium muris RN66]EEA06876.1 hypothetical protein, conserved [Cryptosporidium muris RN66]|eukprot:XP_002141225.1 hypothetical protein [Cryptosporidium muris RN66]
MSVDSRQSWLRSKMQTLDTQYNTMTSQGLPVSEIYKRLAISTTIYTVIGTISASALGSILFKIPSLRRFSTGLGFGIGVGWSMKSSKDYLNYINNKDYNPSIPKSTKDWIDSGMNYFNKIKSTCSDWLK